MPSDPRRPDEIERDIERERAELASTVDALQDKISPEAVIRSIAEGFRDHGGDIGHAVSQSVKQNPMALTLTGIGLAWLVFGRSYDPLADRGQDRPRAVFKHDDDYDDDYDDHDLTVSGSRTRAGASRAGAPYAGGFGAPRRPGAPGVAQYGLRRAARYPDWARHDLDDYDDDFDGQDGDDDSPSLRERASGAASSFGDAASGAADAAKSASDSVVSGAKSAASSVGQAASDAARGTRQAGRRATERARRARERLARGTEDLSEAARDRVVNARARAVAMSRRASDTARRNYRAGRDATQDFVEQQPLVAGALAIAVGAALAGALPRTRREDELLGEMRDDLIDEAERILRNERRKARRVAEAAIDEASAIADEKRDDLDKTAPGRKSAVEAVADELREGGKRVEKAARQTAEREGLGNPKT